MINAISLYYNYISIHNFYLMLKVATRLKFSVHCRVRLTYSILGAEMAIPFLQTSLYINDGVGIWHLIVSLKFSILIGFVR